MTMFKDEKRCSTCYQWKHISEYRKASSRKDGLDSQCKQCIKEDNARKDKIIKTMKYCPTCMKTLPINVFNKDSNRSDGLMAVCKNCMTINKNRNRSNSKANYQTYDILFAEQKGRCTICFSDVLNTDSKDQRLCIDHDHETGEVRGLLCRRCNLGLANFNDNIDNLYAAIDYLDAYNEKKKSK